MSDKQPIVGNSELGAGPTVDRNEPHNFASRMIALVYGLACYAAFLIAFLYAVGFVSNRAVPKAIDSGKAGTQSEALLINAALLGLFAVQHSVMARPPFKTWWTQIVPSHLERSTYVLATSIVLALLFWLWRPMPDVVWQVDPPISFALWALSAVGWLTVLVSTFLIDHFDLFGLRQVWLYATNRPYRAPNFQTRALYKVIRHPIMLGFLISFWAAPTMTQGHLLFAVMTTAYIYVGVSLEERDLRRSLGEDYEQYRRQVGMIVPRFRLRAPKA